MAETKIICDTDVMIDYFDTRQHRHVITKITLEEQIGLENIVLSAISKMELITGASNKTELVTINKSCPVSILFLLTQLLLNYL